MPAFVCYEPLARMAGGVPVIIETKEENNFKLTPEELRAALTPKTKLLVLPYPNNPTGAIMTREDLVALEEVLRGTNVLILSDEIYAELTYGREHCSCAAVPGLAVGCFAANLICGDIYGKPAIIADTHCIRLSNRLGLTTSKNPEIVERQLKAIIPPERQTKLCHNLVHHGRAVCDARKPNCGECPLKDVCVYFKHL